MPRKKSEGRQFHIRLPDDLKAKLESEAKKDNWPSLTSYMVWILTRYIRGLGK